MKKHSINKDIYIGSLRMNAARAKKQALQMQLDELRRGEYDKADRKRLQREIIAAMNAATDEINESVDEIYRQNHAVVSAVLTAFVCMDLVTAVMDDIGDTFNALTIGGMRTELAAFTAECRDVAAEANKVVTGIDAPRNDGLSFAYAEIAEDIVDRLKEIIKERIEQYADSPQGRKYFWGRH